MRRCIIELVLLFIFGFMCFCFGAHFNQRDSGDWSTEVTPGIFDNGIELIDGEWVPIIIDEHK